MALHPTISRLWFAASAPSTSLRIVSSAPVEPKVSRAFRRAVGRAKIGGPLDVVRVGRDGEFFFN